MPRKLVDSVFSLWYAAVTDGSGNKNMQYLSNGGSVIAGEEIGSGGSTTYLYNKDIQNSTKSLLNADGDGITAYDYSDFGETTITGDQNVGNEIAYTGGIYDESTGLYYLNARYYDPEDGRFLTEDTYRGETNDPDTWHLYVYCNNNPINRTDPDGHNPVGIALSGGYYAVPIAVAKVGTFITAVSGGLLVIVGIVGVVYIGKKAYKKVKVKKKAKQKSSKKKKSKKKKNKKQKSSKCFVAGTLVSSKDGDIPIEKIKIGDYVYAYDEQNETIELRKVIDTYVSYTNELIHIKVNDEEIITTPSHQFYTIEGKWKEAQDLTLKDLLMNKEGNPQRITSIKRENSAKSIKVYNLNVEGLHTYIVSESMIVVHNKCGPNLQFISDKYLKKKGLNAHEIKYEYLGERTNIKHYDLYYDKVTKVIYILRKSTKK